MVQHFNLKTMLNGNGALNGKFRLYYWNICLRYFEFELALGLPVELTCKHVEVGTVVQSEERLDRSH